MIRVTICFFISFLLFACRFDKIDNSPCFSMHKSKYLTLPILSQKLVLLKGPTEGISPIYSVDKILVDSSYIFILDGKTNPLVYVYDKSGQFKTVVGGIGQGPTEYMTIRDFDISKDSIYIYDDRQKRIQVYNLNNFAFSRTINLEFRARGFSLLRNKSIIFASTKESCNDQIIITDLNGSIKRGFLPFDDECRDQRRRSNIFQKNDQEGILTYNRPEDNRLYFFSMDNGVMKDSFDLSGIEENVYFSTTPVVIRDKIIGNCDTESLRSLYFVDRSDSSRYTYNSRVIDTKKQDIKFSELLLPVCNHNNYIISYISLDMIDVFCDLDRCPENIINCLREDGIVISFFEL